MATPEDSARIELLRQVRCAWVIAKKNARVYYLKGPVVTFGIVFPLFFYLSFAAGHDAPVSGMVLSKLVRLPLIFVSGVFVPHAQMPVWGQGLSPLSPLSYCADLIRVGFGGTAFFSVTTDVLALASFSLAFMAAAHYFHRRTRNRLA
jgi:ABC-2 type transport system permease protein